MRRREAGKCWAGEQSSDEKVKGDAAGDSHKQELRHWTRQSSSAYSVRDFRAVVLDAMANRTVLQHSPTGFSTQYVIRRNAALQCIAGINAGPHPGAAC